VVHLDPQHRSELSSIVAARTRMPVVQVETTAHLEPNHVYVIPPDRRLQVVDHQLMATEFEEPRGSACRSTSCSGRSPSGAATDLR